MLWQRVTSELYNLPSFLFFILWVVFPVWLAKRRRQGLIRIERLSHEESSEWMGNYFELGIFLFAIPFTCFFIFVTANLVLSGFIPETSDRFKFSVEATSLVMDTALLLYMYLAEKKIRRDRTKRNDGQEAGKESSHRSS